MDAAGMVERMMASWCGRGTEAGLLLCRRGGYFLYNYKDCKFAHDSATLQVWSGHQFLLSDLPVSLPNLKILSY
jgi:hypothetical protein